jgi:hypothetical protein
MLFLSIAQKMPPASLMVEGIFVNGHSNVMSRAIYLLQAAAGYGSPRRLQRLAMTAALPAPFLQKSHRRVIASDGAAGAWQSILCLRIKNNDGRVTPGHAIA